MCGSRPTMPMRCPSLTPSSTSYTPIRCCSTSRGPSTPSVSSVVSSATTGVVAARDVDYEGVIWYPLIPGLAEWHEVYLRVHRRVAGDPAAGRKLKSWAREAGFEDVTSSASLWLFETDEDRSWWGSNWAERALESSFAQHAVDFGVTDREGLERIAAGWRAWADAADGWFLMPHGEIVARG